MTEALDTAAQPQGFFSDSRRYTIGPTAGLNLPLNFAVEADALYKRFNVGTPRDTQSPNIPREAQVNSWEFPIVLRYYGGGGAAPFIGVGASFRRWSDFSQLGSFITGAPSNDELLNNQANTGFVLSGGLRFNLGLIKVTPELRFTRWGVQNIASGFRTLLETNKNQAEILVGFTF